MDNLNNNSNKAHMIRIVLFNIVTWDRVDKPRDQSVGGFNFYFDCCVNALLTLYIM